MTAEELPSSRCFCAVGDYFFSSGSCKLAILASQSHAQVISPCDCVSKTANLPQQWGDNNIEGVDLGLWLVVAYFLCRIRRLTFSPDNLFHLLCLHLHLPPLDQNLFLSRDTIVNLPVVGVERTRDEGGWGLAAGELKYNINNNKIITSLVGQQQPPPQRCTRWGYWPSSCRWPQCPCGSVRCSHNGKWPRFGTGVSTTMRKNSRLFWSERAEAEAR